MKRMKSYIDDIANAMRKDKMMKAFADKFVKCTKNSRPKKVTREGITRLCPWQRHCETVEHG